ncbi:hypothetical protein JTB14_026725 [Gonioctena quinquepunctata]|nr:hypothetical protein JTB14_026725 [Gonioctena quinquepunctata]
MEKIGCVPLYQVSLQLRREQSTAGSVMFHMRFMSEWKKELDYLEADGIICPVAVTDWRSPLVVISKPNGGVRLCVDFKCGVNEQLVQANTPIQRIDDK